MKNKLFIFFPLAAALIAGQINNAPLIKNASQNVFDTKEAQIYKKPLAEPVIIPDTLTIHYQNKIAKTDYSGIRFYVWSDADDGKEYEGVFKDGWLNATFQPKTQLGEHDTFKFIIKKAGTWAGQSSDFIIPYATYKPKEDGSLDVWVVKNTDNTFKLYKHNEEIPITDETFTATEVGYEFKTGDKFIIAGSWNSFITSNVINPERQNNLIETRKINPENNPIKQPGMINKLTLPVKGDYVFRVIGNTIINSKRYYNIATDVKNESKFLGYDGNFGFTLSSNKSDLNSDFYLWSFETIASESQKIPTLTKIFSKAEPNGPKFIHENGKNTSMSSFDWDIISTYVRRDNVAINDLAEFIMKDNTKNQCTTKFAEAKKQFLALSDKDKDSFKVSNDIIIELARERYEAWAINQGSKPYEVGGLTTITDVTLKNNIMIITIVAITAIAVTGISVLAIKRKRYHK